MPGQGMRQLERPALPPFTLGKPFRMDKEMAHRPPSLATNRLLSDKTVHRRRSIGTESVTVSGWTSFQRIFSCRQWVLACRIQ